MSIQQFEGFRLGRVEAFDLGNPAIISNLVSILGKISKHQAGFGVAGPEET